ncbi:BglG family transcription antiterminator [Alteribacter natronophilus]|uniref:BglG family transcription antiterminator n=1 Tax=Alteribacter natronophilus TaxID=2583810 RepID=UPI00110F4D97|nr:BglG family transcription antiterminator [Alteribacter natronophilus]TMW70065.1 transcription antiterminator [Alteribacter natronophilus]
MYVSARERNILNLLLEAPDGLTVKAIAEELNVSKRTVQRDLPGIDSILDEYGLLLERKTGSGLLLSGDEAGTALLRNKMKELEPSEYTPEERHQLLLSILLQENEPVKLYTLARELHVTISTISNDLNRVENRLARFGLELIRRRSYGIEIRGEEGQKRKALRSLITEQMSEEQFFSVLESKHTNSSQAEEVSGKVLNLLDSRVIHEVMDMLHDLRNEGEAIGDASIIGLAVHLSLAVHRVRNGESIGEHEIHLEKAQAENEYRTALKIITKLEKRLGLDIPESEAGYVTMHLLGARQGDESPVYFQETSMDIALSAKQLAGEVEKHVNLPLAGGQSLIEGLISHLKPALFRIRNGMKIYNSLLPEIKRDYGELFGIVRSAVDQVFTDEAVPEEETGFLVLHFGSAIEKAGRTRRTDAIVVCSSGIGTSKLLAARLEKEIPEISRITHKSVFDVVEEEIPVNTIVVSTVPLTSIPNYFLVNPFLSAKEAERIREHLHRLSDLPGEGNASKTREAGREHQPDPGEGQNDFQTIQEVSSLIKILLDQFELKHLPAVSGSEEIVRELGREQKKKGLVRDESEIAGALLKREAAGGLAIPGTSLALFHTRTDSVVTPSFTIRELELPVPLRGMDNEKAHVRRILLMLAPEDWSQTGIEVMSYISAMIIESDESIRLFENGDEQSILSFLEKKLKEYMISKLQ